MSNTIVQETTTLKSKISVKIWAKIPAEYNHECKAETKNIFEETEKQEPINFILQENSTTDIEEKSVGCSQMFSESHKAREKSINLEPTCSRSIDVQAKVYDKNFLLKLPKKKPKTAAERNREYRARKKALKNAKNLGLTSDVQENCLLYLKKKMKTPADRSREYRARQKVLKKITTCSELIAINSEASQENSDGQKKSKIVSQNSILKNLLTGSFSTNNPSDKKIHKNFENKFINVPKILGNFCSVCDNLCVKEDVKSAPKRHKLILSKILPLTSIEKIFLCTTCLKSFDNYRIPKMSSVRRRIKSPEIPDRLPPVDILSGCVNGNVFIVVEKVDNSSNVITGDVSDNANPPMQVDTKDPTLTSTMSDSNSLEGPTINENLDIKEEYVNEELLEEEELMAVDPLAI